MKNIYFIDRNLKKENSYSRYINNKKCIFSHFSEDKYNYFDILEVHMRIKEYIKTFLSKTKIKIDDNNLYMLQYYINMKFIKLLRS